MKTIAKKIIGIMLIVMVNCFAWGICKAEEESALSEAIPIAPFGAVDTTAPTFEWTSVPGATAYCLLIEDIDGEPVFLEWYSAEEAGCTAAESEVCAVTPSHIVHGVEWSVLPCFTGDCGQWSNPATFGVVDTADIAYPQYPAARSESGNPKNPACVDRCMVAASKCVSRCNTLKLIHPYMSLSNRAICKLSCETKKKKCIAACPVDCPRIIRSCEDWCRKNAYKHPKWYACRCLKGPDGIFYNCTSLIILRCRVIEGELINECRKTRCTAAKLCR